MALKRTSESRYVVQLTSILTGLPTRRYFRTRKETATFKRQAEAQRKRVIEWAKEVIRVEEIA